jgi:hypothetical protein
MAMSINVWADWNTKLKTNPMNHVAKQLLCFGIIVVTSVNFWMTRRSIKASLFYSWLLTIAVSVLIIEVTCLNYPKVENIRSTEGLITIIATLSMISYNQLTYLIVLCAFDIYFYVRLILRFGTSIPYVRLNLFLMCALLFIYIFSRALHSRYREDFIIFVQQREMITILQSVVKANHEGILITDRDKIVYHNLPLAKILKIK